MWKKKAVLGIALGAAIAFGMAEGEASPFVSEKVYQWVQSTSRASYYFNKQQIKYGVDEDGFIDFNRLIVPVLKVYDSVQIEDVVVKRRWKMMPLDGYDNLAGAAEYLDFNLADKTVMVTMHNDLDAGWNSLNSEACDTCLKLEDFSEEDVDGKFYRAIVEYASSHEDEVFSHTSGELKDEDKDKDKAKALKKESDEPILKLNKN